jgi:hypothetical protein
LTSDYRLVLREGVLAHRFPESVVAFHPDTGDTIAMELACGLILVILSDARTDLDPDDLRSRIGSCLPETPPDADFFEVCVAELEARDLVRVTEAS